jgi:hypothetical protein
MGLFEQGNVVFGFSVIFLSFYVWFTKSFVVLHRVSLPP